MWLAINQLWREIMGFRQQSNQQMNNSNNDQAWKASGFLNLYLPSQDGKRAKLGAIALRDNNEKEAQLVKWLSEDPTRAAKILAKLEIEYRSAEPKAGSGFALD